MRKILLILLVLLGSFSFALAQSGIVVDYGEDLILDSDLDGLTDAGETQRFNTDPLDPDSDGDGFLDGAEVMGGSDALDPNYPAATKIIKETRSFEQSEIPWSWYLTRGFGLVGFVLLYLSILFGLAIRIPRINALTSPIIALDFHKWFSLHAIIFSLAHGLALLFDKTVKFNLADVFVPFASEYESVLVGFGIVGFYLMVILLLTSYYRKLFDQKVWRVIHFLNIFAYLGVSAHMWFLGTDMKNFSFKYVFVAMNLILAFFILLNIQQRMRIKRKIEEQT